MRLRGETDGNVCDVQRSNFVVTDLKVGKAAANLLPAFQVQVLIWTGDSGSNPERVHGHRFLWM